MTTITTITDVPAVSLDETEAAELEGVAPLPADLVALLSEARVVKEQLEVLEARKKEIRDIFKDRLVLLGLVGFVVNGKVKIRKSVYTKDGFNVKDFAAKHPVLFRRFKTTSAPITSITID